MHNDDTHTAGEEMIRSTYTAPNLIGGGDEDPLLERARALVAEDFPNTEERNERTAENRPKQ